MIQETGIHRIPSTFTSRKGRNKNSDKNFNDSVNVNEIPK